MDGYTYQQEETCISQTRQACVEAALAAYVERVTRLYSTEIAFIILFGSQARGDFGAESDIDVLVVLQNDSPALREALADVAWQVQHEYGVVISDILRSVEQFEHMRANRFPFYQSLEREGIVLWKRTSEPTPVFA